MSTEVLVPIYEAIETPEEKPVPETLFSTQLKIEELVFWNSVPIST